MSLHPFEEVLIDAIELREGVGHDFALVGGHAVSIRARERFTQDLDLAISVVSDEESEEVTRGFLTKGYEIIQLLNHKPTGRLGTVRLKKIKTGLALDLMFCSTGIENEIVSSAESFSLTPTLRIRVALRGHLIAMKLLSYNEEERLQDKIDLQSLFSTAQKEDIGLARTSVRLIQARGFHRERQLEKDLDRCILELRDEQRDT